MSLRAFLIVPPVTLGLLASPGPSTQPSLTLRIESLSQFRHAFSVTVTTGVFGDERRKVQRPDTVTVLQLPATMDVADSIGKVRVVVAGFAAVRVTLTDSAAPGDSLVSIGRDITLSRKPKGRFARVWTAHPLIP